MRSDKGKKHVARGDWKAAYEKYLSKVYNAASRQGLNKEDMKDYVLGELDFELNFRKRYNVSRNSAVTASKMADSTLREAGISTRQLAIRLRMEMSKEDFRKWAKDNAAARGYSETGKIALNIGAYSLDDIRGNENLQKLYYEYFQEAYDENHEAWEELHPGMKKMRKSAAIATMWTDMFYYGSK